MSIELSTQNSQLSFIFGLVRISDFLQVNLERRFMELCTSSSELFSLSFINWNDIH